MINPHRHLDAVVRTVDTVTDPGQPERRRLVATRTYPTDAADLWDALTNPDRIPRWFLPIGGELRIGGRFQLEGNAGGEVLACEPPRHLHITWEYADDVSWVDVALSPAPDGGTVLELTHLVPVSEHWAEYGPGATGIGWETVLMGLDEHVTTGFTVDPGAGLAFLGSPDGIAFVAASGRAWADAAVTSGADADWARAAEARNRAAWTLDPGDPDDT